MLSRIMRWRICYDCKWYYYYAQGVAKFEIIHEYLHNNATFPCCVFCTRLIYILRSQLWFFFKVLGQLEETWIQMLQIHSVAKNHHVVVTSPILISTDFCVHGAGHCVSLFGQSLNSQCVCHACPSAVIFCVWLHSYLINFYWIWQSWSLWLQGVALNFWGGSQT